MLYEPISLDDEALARAGFVRTSAYVRTDKSKKAIRQERHRKKREAAGTRQINVETTDTEDARNALRSLAAAMQDGAVSPAAVVAFVENGGKAPRDVRPGEGEKPMPSPPAPDPLAVELARLRQMLVAGGWRARVLRWLARWGVGAAKRRPGVVGTGAPTRRRAPHRVEGEAPPTGGRVSAPAPLPP